MARKKKAEAIEVLPSVQRQLTIEQLKEWLCTNHHSLYYGAQIDNPDVIYHANELFNRQMSVNDYEKGDIEFIIANIR